MFCIHRIPIYSVRLVREASLPTERKVITDAAVAAEVLWQYLAEADREHFIVLLLDAKNRLIGINTVSVGHLNSTLVHPREVFKPVLLASAAAAMVGHNHLSGDPTPSREDRAITRRLAEAGKLLGIRVLDHVIIAGATSFYSFANHGEL